MYRSDRYNNYDFDTDNNSDNWQGMGSSSNSPKSSFNEDQKKSEKQSNTGGKGGSSKNNVKKKQSSDAPKVDPKKTDGYNIEDDEEEKTGKPEYDQANEKLVNDIKDLNQDIQNGLTEIKKSETKKDKKVEKSKEVLSTIAKDVNKINDDMEKIKEQKLPAEKPL